MKKRQIGVLGVVIGQAVALFHKDQELRNKIKEEQGLLGKAKILGEGLIKENKELYKEISDTDWDKTLEDIEKHVAHDSETVKQWAKNQENKDWEKQGHAVVREVINAIPDKKTLAEGAEKYKNRIITRWNNL